MVHPTQMIKYKIRIIIIPLADIAINIVQSINSLPIAGDGHLKSIVKYVSIYNDNICYQSMKNLMKFLHTVSPYQANESIQLPTFFITKFLHSIKSRVGSTDKFNQKSSAFRRR